MWVPGPVSRDLIAEVLVIMSKSTYGPAGFSMPALNLARFQRPLFKLPAGEVAFSVWLFPRTVPAGEASAHVAMMAETREFFERMTSVGGKNYVAHSSIRLSPAEWEDHFGPDTWRRLAASKKRFDPNQVLKPGPGIFTPRLPAASALRREDPMGSALQIGLLQAPQLLRFGHSCWNRLRPRTAMRRAGKLARILHNPGLRCLWKFQFGKDPGLEGLQRLHHRFASHVIDEWTQDEFE
jgi:hypothetical protein